MIHMQHLFANTQPPKKYHSPMAAEHAMVKVCNVLSEHNAPSSRPLSNNCCNLGRMTFLQYEYTPKYNPTLGMEPNALTPNPAYKFNTPPGRLVILRPASSRPRDLPPSTCCWTVFSVSNGASIVLEQAAARPDASVFFRPSVMADDDDFVVVDDDFAVVEDEALLVLPPPRMRCSRAVD